MKIPYYWLLILISVIFGGLARGADASDSTGSSTAYHLRPGDKLEIAKNSIVLGGVDFQIVTITKEGMIQLAALHPLKLAGLTIDDATKIVVKAYSDQKVLYSVRFLSISILDYAPCQISVRGQVLYPGVLVTPEKEPMTVVKAITQAGGLKPKASHNLTLVRPLPDGKATTTNVNFFEAESDPNKDLPLHDGDTLTAL